MVLKQIGMNGPYECYYRHTDGYPSGLRSDLIEALRSPFVKDWEGLVKECRLQDEKRTVTKPEDAFLKVQGDLEYLYVVEGFDNGTVSLAIYKTSSPHDLPDFAWRIWFSYKQYFPSPADVVHCMADLELMAGISLRGLEAYHRANGLKPTN